MKILHVVGGSFNNGAFKGAKILHDSLINLNIDSKILNDNFLKNKKKEDNEIIFLPDNYIKKILHIFFIYIEKILKSLFLKSPRETFTIGLFGFDLTKLKAYQDADIIHIHWLNQGFINLKSLSKVKKPLIWTMRDMWAFTGGSHYTMDFEYYENNKISNFLKNLKKKYYKKNFQFVAVSGWLKKKAENSNVLNQFKIKKIDNNIDIKNLKLISKKDARKILNISTKKKIILYGAQNPQSKRKGWEIFIDTLKKMDKSEYYLLIFGNFWSENILKKIGIEFKNLGYINDKNQLNTIYSAADLFVASSIADAWPKTFAEAMACGLPVVCFKNTSISEIVDHKINGFVVDKFSSELLKNGIDWLSKEIEKGGINIDNVKKKALKYNGDDVARKYLELYIEIKNKTHLY